MSDPLVVITNADAERVLRDLAADAMNRSIELVLPELRDIVAGLAMTKPVLSAREVAVQYFDGVTPKHVMETVRLHGLPCHRPAGRAMFVRAEVEAWITRRATDPAAVTT